MIIKIWVTLARSYGPVDKHLSHHPKVAGLSPAVTSVLCL